MTFYSGIIPCIAASVLFGSIFVPIRMYDIMDGMFAQFMFAVAAQFIGFAVFVFRDFPGFYPLAMLGGVSWAIGNVTAFTVIPMLGIGVATFLYSVAFCVIGWATGRFGLFGTEVRKPASDALNLAGLFCVFVGGVLFSKIEKTPNDKFDAVTKDDLAETEIVKKPTVDEKIKRITGVLGAVTVGLFYGLAFVPVVYMVDNPEKYPEHPAFCMDYFFSLCFGKFLAATTIFMAYSIAKNNKPILPQNIALPSFTSGLIWSIGQAFFFIANEELSPAITFPIVSMLPSCVVSAWSVLYFHEIGGRRNFIYLAVAMAVSITGTLFVALSKSVTSPN
ncbi:hypothetical protein Q1695_010296 [Nippostrongylus brasiliensis]|nr:hypothetical protein Q1695_010296 [Nippostrongylus brasiliensis]